MLRNLASSLFLTEGDEDAENAPAVKGRVVTTLQKAKEVRPLVEKCITIARRSLISIENAEQFGTTEMRPSEGWRAWRTSPRWQEWNQAMAPAVAGRRRVIRLLGSKNAARILFDEVAPRFADRPGGYTRILRLAKPRLGDAGTRAILEFVGKNDRVRQKSSAPKFEESPKVEDESNVDSTTPSDQPVASGESAASDEKSATSDT